MELAYLSVLILSALAGVAIGVAVVVAVFRAKQEDLPEIVKYLMRVRSSEDKADSDAVETPPALPKS